MADCTICAGAASATTADGPDFCAGWVSAKDAQVMAAPWVTNESSSHVRVCKECGTRRWIVFEPRDQVYFAYGSFPPAADAVLRADSGVGDVLTAALAHPGASAAALQWFAHATVPCVAAIGGRLGTIDEPRVATTCLEWLLTAAVREPDALAPFVDLVRGLPVRWPAGPGVPSMLAANVKQLLSRTGG